MEATEWIWVKSTIFDIITAVGILTFVSRWFKSKQDALDDRFQRIDDKLETRFKSVEEKQNDLSATCVRREEMIAAVNSALTPVTHQLVEIRQQQTEIRHRVDDLYTIQKNKKD